MKFFLNTFILLIIICVFLEPASVIGAEMLSSAQILRLREAHSLLRDAEDKTFPETRQSIEQSPYSEEMLIMLEAVAKTYADIAREHNVEGAAKKAWLLSMVRLNLAYLQLGGEAAATEDVNDGLNRLIRKYLKSYLPPELLQRREFFHSLE